MGVPLVLEAIAGRRPAGRGLPDRPQPLLPAPTRASSPTSWPRCTWPASAVRLDGLDGPDGLWKLGGVVRRRRRAGAGRSTAPGRWPRCPPTPTWPPLFQACAERRQATFTYNDEVRLDRPPPGRLPAGPLVPDRLRPRPRRTSATSASTASPARSTLGRARRLRAAGGRPARACPTTRGAWARDPRSSPACWSTPTRWPGPPASWARPRWPSAAPTARPCSRWRSPTGRPSARSCSASSTTPRCWAPPAQRQRDGRLAVRPGRGAPGEPGRRVRAGGPPAQPGAVGGGPGQRVGRGDLPALRHRSPTSCCATSTPSRWSGCTPTPPTCSSSCTSRTGRCTSRCPRPSTARCSSPPNRRVALVAAGSTLLTVPGADPEGPLARGLAKLSAAVGAAGGEASLEVRLGEVRDDVLETSCRPAVRQHRQVAIDYYAYGRDTHTHRVIDPYRVTSDQGQWYAAAWCHLADDERLFRLDRISTRRAARHHLRPAGRPAPRVGVQPVGRRPPGGDRARPRGPLGGRAVPGRSRSKSWGRPAPGHPGRDRAGRGWSACCCAWARPPQVVEGADELRQAGPRRGPPHPGALPRRRESG